MNRYDIINNLIQKYDYKTYLEIGVRNSDECFNLLIHQSKPNNSQIKRNF